MSLNLNPDIEARLIALAQSSGVSVEDFPRHVVEEKTEHSSARQLSPEQWSAEFEEWANSFPEAAPIPDEALSRENLYPDRWMPVLVDTNIPVPAVQRNHPLTRFSLPRCHVFPKHGHRLR